MDSTAETLLTLLLIVLTPMIPAFVLFKALRSTGGAQGTVFGVRYDFGGSFAGYFVLFLILIFTRDTWLPRSYQVWHLDATIVDESGHPLKFEDENTKINIVPNITFNPDGSISADVISRMSPGHRTEDYAKLSISHKTPNGTAVDSQTYLIGPQEAAEPWMKKAWKIDARSGVVHIGRVDLGASSTPYNGSGPTPTAISLPR